MLSKWWDSYWFSTIDGRQYAALRIAFGGLSAVYFFYLLPFVASQFSGSGWLTDIQQLPAQQAGSWSLLFIPMGRFTVEFAYLIVGIGIIAAVMLLVGWHSRWAAALTWIVWVSMWNRNSLLLDGDDALLKMMSFYLLLSPCGNSWSIDARLKKQSEQVVVWPLRLMQFQIVLLYFVSGWVKFHSPQWLDGTILNYVLIHPQYSLWDGWRVIHLPGFDQVSVAITWLIRWWEVLFPVLLILPVTRKISLSMGVLFHIGLLLTMNLRGFALIMLATYLALIDNRRFLVWEKQWLRFACRS